VEAVCCITGEGGVNAIAEGFLDGGVVSLFACGGRKYDHVEVQKEPPKGSAVIDVLAVGCGYNNCSNDGSLEVAKDGSVARSKEVMPSDAEVGGFMVIDG
jgi:hypothetical protein